MHQTACSKFRPSFKSHGRWEKEIPENPTFHWYEGTHNSTQEWAEKVIKEEREKFGVEGGKGFHVPTLKKSSTEAPPCTLRTPWSLVWLKTKWERGKHGIRVGQKGQEARWWEMLSPEWESRVTPPVEDHAITDEEGLRGAVGWRKGQPLHSYVINNR